MGIFKEDTMKGFLKGIKEYLALVLYLVIFLIVITCFAIISVTFKDKNLDLYKRIVFILGCLLWVYILIADVFYPGLVSKILNYKYKAKNKYKLRVFMNNIIRFGILGLPLVLYVHLEVYPKYLNLINILYLVNLVFCFIPKYNCTLAHKLLGLDMVRAREKKQ